MAVFELCKYNRQKRCHHQSICKTHGCAAMDALTFEYKRPDINILGIQIVESELCLQTWQLSDFTKELMGAEWVAEFNRWAEHAMPKQPTCYMLGRYKMIAHPSVSRELRKKIEESRRNDFQTSLSWGVVCFHPLGHHGA